VSLGAKDRAGGLVTRGRWTLVQWGGKMWCGFVLGIWWAVPRLRIAFGGLEVLCVNEVVVAVVMPECTGVLLCLAWRQGSARH